MFEVFKLWICAGQIVKKLVAPITPQQLTAFLTDLTEQEAVIDGEPEAEEALNKAFEMLQLNEIQPALQLFSGVAMPNFILHELDSGTWFWPFQVSIKSNSWSRSNI